MGDHSHSSGRTVWIDVCKGICIVLVVFGHVSGGLEASGFLAHDSLWMLLRDWVYLFHMPAFFFLSGLFAGKALDVAPGKYLLGRVKGIAYPYVIWTVIIVVAQITMSRFVNNPPDLRRAVRLLIEPYGYGLWFLYALFIISVLFNLLARLKTPSLVMVVAGVGLFWLAQGNCFGFWPALNTALEFFVYYALGAGFWKIISPVGLRGGCWLHLLAGAVLFLIMTVLFLYSLVADPFSKLLAAVLGLAAVVNISLALADAPSVRFWALLGLFSLEIYLGHPLWSTLARAILLKAGFHSGLLLIAGGMVAGIVISLSVGMACRRWNFPWLFRWPTSAHR